MTASRATDNASEDKTKAPLTLKWIWLALLLALAVFIRVHGANDYRYGGDESWHVYIAGSDTLQKIWEYSHYETHPPLLYVLCHYWMMISADPAFVRGMNLLIGVMLILLYYRIGHLLGGELAGFCCAAIIAFSYGCIIQSYAVRQYMPLVFFLALAFYCYMRWRRKRNYHMLLAYGCFGALACVTHFSGIFAIACFLLLEGMESIRQRKPFRDTAGWLCVNGIVVTVALAIYLSWRPTLIRMIFTR
jgi:uncharacterized membrane protein